MFRYILKRIALMFLSFFIIMTTCFFLVKMLPLVVNATLGQDAEIAEAQIVARGYRDPILVQYFAYIRRILFGVSLARLRGGKRVDSHRLWR